MDAMRLGIDAIKNGIEKGAYVLTGILETGEVVIALTDGNADEKFIKDIIEGSESNETKLEKTKRLMRLKGRPAQELMQVYEQKCNISKKRCRKNGLIIRRS